MGILLMNIAAYALPEAAYSNPRAYGGTGFADLALWAINFVLIDGKMRALFSLLFGASMLLVIERAEANGEDGQKVHFRRMGWLLVFGLIHAFLIWYGDILTPYAVMGIVAWFFTQRSTRVLLRWGIALLVVQMLIMAAMTAMMASVAADAAAPGATAEAREAWRDLNIMLGIPGAADLREQVALYRGGYVDLVRHRLSEAVPLFQVIIAGPETLGLMLLGMAGLRSGFLTGAWDAAAYRRVMRYGYAIGLPPMILIAGYCLLQNFDPISVVGATLVATAPFRPIIMIAHAALLLLWLRGPSSPLKQRVAAAGRAAFTNYLGTSLLLTFVFYGHGLALFGTLGRAELYLVVAVIWLLMLGWSKPWLDRFRYGPLEWLWRRLARGKPARE